MVSRNKSKNLKSNSEIIIRQLERDVSLTPLISSLITGGPPLEGLSSTNVNETVYIVSRHIGSILYRHLKLLLIQDEFE